MEERTGKSGQLSRRSFLKTTGVVAAAGFGAASGASALGSLAERAVAVEVPQEESFINMCRGNCGGRCLLRSTVREGKIVKTQPEEVPAGAEAYRHGCVKGAATPQRLYAANRILYPMKRVEGTERGAGEWERITWDEAFGTIAERFKDVADTYGPAANAMWFSWGSIGYLNGAASGFSNAGGYSMGGSGLGFLHFIKTFAPTTITPSADMSEMYMQYVQLLFPGNSQNDPERSKCILIWGLNPTDAVRGMWPSICTAKENGAKIVTIDPQYTTAAAHSDIWVPIRPGTDGAFALAMANYLIEQDKLDYDFLKNQSVAPLLIKEDGTYLKMSDLGVEPQEGPVNMMTGQPTVINPEVVIDETTGQPVAQTETATPALRGSYEVAGFKVRPVYDLVLEKIAPFTVEFAAEECGLEPGLIRKVADLYADNSPSTIATYQGLGHHANSRHTYKNLLLLACLTGNMNKPGATIYHNYVTSKVLPKVNRGDMIEALMTGVQNMAITSQLVPRLMETGKYNGQDFPIRNIMFINGNPLASESGRQAMIQAALKADFLVTADSFMTDTAKYSDMVLPVCLSWEEEDFVSFTQHAMLMQKAVEPAGETKSDMDIYRGIASAMGQEILPLSDEEYLRNYLSDEANVASGCTYDELKEKVYVCDYDFPYNVGVETNPTGRTQFYISEVTPRDIFGQTIEDTERIPWYEPALEATIHNPDLAKYPLFGLSDHNNYHAHSIHNDTEWLTELKGEPSVRIHKNVAEARGISQGDLVRVYNDRGYAVLKAVVTTGIREDTVLMPHGWQSYHYIGGHHQDLTLVYEDPITGNGAFNDYLCEIELYKGGNSR